MQQKSNFPNSLQAALDKRKQESLLRKLHPENNLFDFCSNDYLGFSRSEILQSQIDAGCSAYGNANGATGSRLISGNNIAIENLENKIAQFHNAEAGLIFNSGYDANLGLLSAIGKKEDVFLYDDLVHASLHDGMRLSLSKHYKFKHNDVSDLERLLIAQQASDANCYVLVESVYSMDGDLAPLKEIIALKEKYNFYLVVDEAHATGVFGKQGSGLCNELNIEDKCFARMYTFGKALGVHGAIVLGSTELKNYLINFSRSFIYTTALAPHAYAAIDAAYEYLQSTNQIEVLKTRIQQFNSLVKTDTRFVSTPSAIQCFMVDGNEAVTKASEFLKTKGMDVRAIKSPTVKAGTERLRICLHSFNSEEQITNLVKSLSES
jgi:8-amino-7-oxononanoate synthase